MRRITSLGIVLSACDPCPGVIPLYEGTPAQEARFSELLEEFRSWTGGRPECIRGISFHRPAFDETDAAVGWSTPTNDLYLHERLSPSSEHYRSVVRHEFCHLLHYSDPSLLDDFPAPREVRPFEWMVDRPPHQLPSEWFAFTCQAGPEGLLAVKAAIAHCPSMQDSADRIDFLLDEVFVEHDDLIPQPLALPELRTATLDGQRLHPPGEAASPSSLVLQPQVRFNGDKPVLFSLTTGQEQPLEETPTYPANDLLEVKPDQPVWTDHATVDFGPWRLTGATAQLPGDLLVGALRVEQPGQPVRMLDACLGGIPVPLDTGAPFPWFFHIEDSNRLSWAPIVLR